MIYLYTFLFLCMCNHTVQGKVDMTGKELLASLVLRWLWELGLWKIPIPPTGKCCSPCLKYLCKQHGLYWESAFLLRIYNFRTCQMLPMCSGLIKTMGNDSVWSYWLAAFHTYFHNSLLEKLSMSVCFHWERKIVPGFPRLHPFDFSLC